MTAASPTPGRRAYRSPRRQQQAAETRAAVLAAAAELFAGRGWTATGMRDVAAAAGVSVETVYANFPSKAELLMAAIDVGVVGDDEPVPLAQRREFAALATGSTADRIAAAARLITAINRRIGGLRRALGEAAVSDPVLAQKVAESEGRRRTNTREGVELVVGRPVDDDVADTVWAFTGVDVFHLLTDIAGWSTRRYEEWVRRTLSRVLTE
ncbi:TetR family transcriptional regulator [Blastococcus jejuensis]|uniref:TetR family transcriptional regulator n=1 Tax=Blastococcus jejuensis TaxID=351224 RepID=A0ABP6NPA5_9ACTN